MGTEVIHASLVYKSEKSAEFVSHQGQVITAVSLGLSSHSLQKVSFIQKRKNISARYDFGSFVLRSG